MTVSIPVETRQSELNSAGRTVNTGFAVLAMSTSPQTDVKILATGLGVDILIDATVVRCLLVPALVSLLGGWNWTPHRVATPREPAPVAAPDPSSQAVGTEASHTTRTRRQ